ncbi:glycosyltransferase family 9 protein [Agarilytica rhodophyticola]|uniref:glycosyltransferase family 9 protein n=1 Tax=Agarilytica rhodophyticola TaxID=1737490 RepID=UPI00131563D0|nr:glycosyltransferase family 9 protein [Agarilytica rhodophyticola]
MPRRNKKQFILIIRLTAIGDIVMSSPIASTLKEGKPNVNVTWLVHPLYKPLLEGHPHIDNVITFDPDEWHSLWRKKNLVQLWRKILKLRQHLKQWQFERTIDLQGNFTTGLIAWLSGAKHRIALGSEGANNWFMTKTISRNLGDQTQIGSEYRYLVNQLGCSDANWRMFVPPPTNADNQTKTEIDEKLGKCPYAIIIPSGYHPQKNWFEDYWQQIILRIRGRYQLRTVIVGGDNAITTGNEIARLTGAINIAGETSLTETIAVMQGASLVIGIDTGLTHMAHAMKIPTISLFGATYPYAYVGNDKSKVIYLDRFCSPCRHKPICSKKYHCMRDITPDKVLTAIKTLMKKSNDENNLL